MAKPEALRPGGIPEPFKRTTGGERKKLTRRQKFIMWTTAATLAGGAALGVGINKAIEGSQGNTEPVNPTVPSITETVPNPDTTIPVIPTTTENPLITTTTQETTTTTTEKQKTWEELINKDVTFENVTNKNLIVKPSKEYFEKIEYFIENEKSKIPKLLQDEAKEKLGIELIYIGKYNIAKDQDKLNGNKLNDCLFLNLSEKGKGFYSSSMWYLGINSIGEDMNGNYNNVYKIVEEIGNQPIILIPNSKDFYVYDEERGIFVRIVRDKNSKHEPTLINYFDLNNTQAFDAGLPPTPLNPNQTELYSNKEKHMARNLTKEELAEFFGLSGTMGFYIQRNKRETSIRDERGIPVVEIAYRPLLDGYEEAQKALFGN